jgi:hypothetical protein
MRLRSAALALACVALGGHAAAQTIYRCDDGKGGVLYVDAPCKDGAKVDMLPGKADPAAIERLKREQKAFDERQAARDARVQADAQAAREARRVREQQASASEPEPVYGYPPWAWGGYYPWPPVPPVRPRPPRPDTTPSYVPAKPGLFQPSPPLVAPRR